MLLMAWNDHLLDEQEQAAAHLGSHARVLAGPGTGKTLTLTRRVLFLIEEKGVSPSGILVLTFTRAAAAELRTRIGTTLTNHDERPQISTLHAFALRQLVLNSSVVERLPSPVRVADDWEERNIILEDLKTRLSYSLKTVRERVSDLSNDWDTLSADDPAWQDKFVDPKFLGAWREHREVYGYTLRSELVYQVKRSLEQSGDFKLDPSFSQILVDEYQDLNQCDLAVIKEIEKLGTELFCAGDDDQSIYGFRHAHPEGIRRFGEDHFSSETLSLSTCMRCDRSIIVLAEFVANLDPDRLVKTLKPRPDAGDGQVAILRFASQGAEGVVKLVDYLVKQQGCTFKDILILLRNDRNGAYSKPIVRALEQCNFPVSTTLFDPMDSDDGRRVKSLLHLIANPDDSLSIRTWLQLRKGVGEKAISALYDHARSLSFRFVGAAKSVQQGESTMPQFGPRIKEELDILTAILEGHAPYFEGQADPDDCNEFLEALQSVLTSTIEQLDSAKLIYGHLRRIVEESGVSTLDTLLTILSASESGLEPEANPDAINIMTMHKAKGLTAEAVIVVAAEDEVLPGKQTDSDQQGDERRLLYVSLTRGKQHLFITYCDRRTGQQMHTGSNPGEWQRHLTRFLQDAPIKPQTLDQFLLGSQ